MLVSHLGISVVKSPRGRRHPLVNHFCVPQNPESREGIKVPNSLVLSLDIRAFLGGTLL